MEKSKKTITIGQLIVVLFGLFVIGMLIGGVIATQANTPVQQHPYQPSYHPLAINAW